MRRRTIYITLRSRSHKSWGFVPAIGVALVKPSAGGLGNGERDGLDGLEPATIERERRFTGPAQCGSATARRSAGTNSTGGGWRRPTVAHQAPDEPSARRESR